MADIRTLDQLQDALDSEMGWRVKEIGAFSLASREAAQRENSLYGQESHSFTHTGKVS